jgi:uncharacterized protein YdaU (DUF1376 family)
MKTPPAFQLYAADFYMDTASWPIEAVGIYSRFLFYQWVNGFLPSNERELSRIAGCGISKLKKNFNFWSPKFVQNGDGKLQNIRLEETRKKQVEYRENQAMSGRMGGLSTQGKKKESTGEPLSNGSSKPSSEIEALQSSSSSSKKEITLCPHKEIVQTYNDILGHKLTTVKYELWPDSSRAKYLQARWKENKRHQSIEFWKGLFEYIRDKCPFLVGDTGQPFRADLEWIVKKDNFIKIIEGKYVKR